MDKKNYIQLCILIKNKKNDIFQIIINIVLPEIRD